MSKYPVTPGETIRMAIKAKKTSVVNAAKEMEISRMHLYSLMNDDVSINITWAIKLGNFFQNDPEFWLTLQHKFDMFLLKEKLNQTKC